MLEIKTIKRANIGKDDLKNLEDQIEVLENMTP